MADFFDDLCIAVLWMVVLYHRIINRNFYPCTKMGI